MKKIISIIALVLCTLAVSAQKSQKTHQVAKTEYEFILPQKPELEMEYPKDVRLDDNVQTYKALSYDGSYAFIYNEKHCGYYDVPMSLRSGFRSSVSDLQKENSSLYWKRVKEIMADIDKYWNKQKSSSVDESGYISKSNRTSGGGKVFDVVEVMPQFPGGMGALMQYLSSHIKYPVEAETNRIEGRVICTFIVEKDGSISDIEVSRSVDPSLDKEAVRVISSMPAWTPGWQNGKPCRVKFTLPVTFKL